MAEHAIASQIKASIEGLKVLPWDDISAQQQAQIASAMARPLPRSIAPNANATPCIAFPETTPVLSQLMTLAAKQGWRILTTGQGSKLSWGGLAKGIDLVISTARLNKVVEHAIGDFTVTVEAGVKFADLQQQLAVHNQFLAIDPAYCEQATLGGIVATADAGSLRQRYGGLRDMLIGVQFVRHDGEVAKAGGRVVKNVAGYDLMKLVTGAYGSLGVLSELTFRLYPVTQASRTLVLIGGEMAVEKAIAEVRLSGLTPVALDLTMAEQVSALIGRADGPSVEVETEKGPQLSLVARFQGIVDGVEEQSIRLKTIATTHSMAIHQLDGEVDKSFWQQVSGLVRADSTLCKVGMRPSALPALLAQLPDRCQVLVHGSSGLGWVQWPMPSADVEGQDVIKEIEWARSHTQSNGGFLSILQAPSSLKQSVDVWGYTGNALKVMGDIKQKFDPDGRLNPGRFVGGL
ncbi:MAG: FAD-binding oxidoreductase [Cyanobacteria bacterium J06555_13]